MTIATISDLRPLAKRRLPRFVFDYLDGAAGDERGMLRNLEAFGEVLLKPRMLMDVEERDFSTTLMGKKWSLPFGTAPIGFCNLMCPGGEQAVALAAREANIPCTLSTSGTTSMEKYRDYAPENAWYQLYVSRVREIADDLVKRADDTGYETLVVTVDIPVAARRTRDIRNNFSVALKVGPKFIWELVSHPTWSLATLQNGIPRFENMERYTRQTGAKPVAGFVSSQISGRFNWDELKKLRDRWKRKLVVKGLLTAEDTVKARDLGIDAVVVSNHGGRQIEALAAPIEVIGEIREAVGPNYPLILDSGIRSGEDVLKALAAGADFVLLGRAMMFGIAGLGPKGAKLVINMIADEMSRAAAQIGYTDVASLKAAAPVIRRK